MIRLSQPVSGGHAMHSFREFWLWITLSSEKTEKIEFKNRREAAEFVRRVYNENGSPNKALIDLYKRGQELKAKGDRAFEHRESA